jgi:hypothetical protein
MADIIQLNPPLPLNTPKGSALAHFLIDLGPEHNIQWVCFQDDTGQCWTWMNSDVRAPRNVTMHRTTVEDPRA